MAGRPTDHRNLDLTQLSLDVPYRRAGGKVIWEPRILAWYDDRAVRKYFPMPQKYEGMSSPQLYRDLGCTNRVYDFGNAVQGVEDPRVRFIKKEVSATEYHVTIETPVGNQQASYRISPNNWWHEPIKWPIT